MEALKIISAGQILTSRSLCDSNCIFTVEVLERNKSFVTVKVGNEIKRCKVSIYDNCEQIYAMGK
jgi:hypothetical protein